MRLGDHVELGCGITGKVIGRTFEEEMRLDLQTPWGVLNGVRLAAIDEGLVLSADREGDAPLKTSRGDGTIDLETPWGRLYAVPMNVLQTNLRGQTKVSVPTHRPTKAVGSVAEKVKEIGRTAAAKRAAGLDQAPLEGEAGPSPVSPSKLSLGRWPKGKRPNGGSPRRVA